MEHPSRGPAVRPFAIAQTDQDLSKRGRAHGALEQDLEGAVASKL